MDKELSDIVKDKEQSQENIENINLSSSALEEISIYDVFSKSKHTVILACISVTVILLPFSDTVYLPAIHTIAVDLDTTDGLVNLTISLYLLSVGILSLIWGVLSDRWGRNLMMRIGLLIFLLSSIFCIFTVNIVMLSLLRILQGGSISVTMVVGQSIIADIYPADQRGWATGLFLVPGLIGVALGPTLGGIFAFYLGWRSIFIFQSIIALIILIIYIIIIPETHQHIVLIKTVDKKIIERNEILKPQLANPFLPLLYLTKLNMIPYILAASTGFANMIINQCLLAITLAEKPYYFNELKIGIAYIPLSIGEIIGSILGGYLGDKSNNFFKIKRLENRLIPGTICYMLVPIGLIIYGWAFQYQLHISIPLISASIVAFGQAVCRPEVYSYLTLKEQQHAATVSSANNFLNFMFAAIGVSISQPLIEAINSGPFYTVIAFINIMAIIPAIIVPLRNIRMFNKNYQPI